jgi:hypothetical protein
MYPDFVSPTSRLLTDQLGRLREEFRDCGEDDLFRMYLHYMLECRPEAFYQIIGGAELPHNGQPA